MTCSPSMGGSSRTKPSTARILPLLPPCRNQMLPVSTPTHHMNMQRSYLTCWARQHQKFGKSSTPLPKAMVSLLCPGSCLHATSALNGKERPQQEPPCKFPTRCPRWSEVTIEERLDIIRKVFHPVLGLQSCCQEGQPRSEEMEEPLQLHR